MGPQFPFMFSHKALTPSSLVHPRVFINSFISIFISSLSLFNWHFPSAIKPIQVLIIHPLRHYLDWLCLVDILSFLPDLTTNVSGKSILLFFCLSSRYQMAHTKTCKKQKQK